VGVSPTVVISSADYAAMATALLSFMKITLPLVFPVIGNSPLILYPKSTSSYVKKLGMVVLTEKRAWNWFNP